MDLGALLPTFLCLVAASFLLGNTIFIRFFRTLLAPIAVCVIAVRAIMHIRADDSTAMTSVFDMVAFGIHFVLGRLKSKSLAFVVSDVVGILIGFATLNLAQDLMILRFGTVKKTVIEKAYGIARHIPAVKALLLKEQTKMEESFEKDLKMKSREIGTKYGGDGPSSYSTLPAKVHHQMQHLLDLLTILSVSIDVALSGEDDSGSMIRSFSTPC